MILGWVPARFNPVAPDDDRQLIIQAQGMNRRSATSGETDDFHPLRPPGKMVGPGCCRG